MPLPLRINDNSFDVQAVRAALKARGFQPGYTVLEPNLYDSWVQLAVARFQKAARIPVTGIVDVRTWQALMGTARQPATAVARGAAEETLHTGESGLALALGDTPSDQPQTGKLMFALAAGAIALWYAKRRGWL